MFSTVAQIKPFLEVDAGDSSRDARLTSLISDVQAIIETYCGRKFEAKTFTERFNGRLLTCLNVRNPPLDTATLPTVKECGVALVPSYGYSATADVVVDPTNGAFYRQAGPTQIITAYRSPGRWSAGIQNIEIAYPGAAFDGGVPGDIMAVFRDGCSFFWQVRGVKAQSTASQGARDATTSYREDFLKVHKATLETYRLHRVS